MFELNIEDMQEYFGENINTVCEVSFPFKKYVTSY